jgi:hypothetical protein
MESNHFKTNFYPPAIMGCRLRLSTVSANTAINALPYPLSEPFLSPCVAGRSFAYVSKHRVGWSYL